MPNNYDNIKEIPGYPKVPLKRSKDISNQCFGEWTVLYRTTNSGSHSMWLCKCSCGTIRPVRKNLLINGLSTSCGHKRIKDLTGQRFGKLIAIENTFQSGHGGYLWKCKCDCGNIVYKGTNDLTSGLIKSCGCGMIKDLTNQKFGKLTVLNKVEDKRNYKGGLIWRCVCECGNIIEVNSEYLISNKVKSCGCSNHISFGELKIKEILQKNKILFVQEKNFKDCVFPNSNKLARFDFFVNNHYIIEYDGIQHFQSNGGWNTEDKLQLNINHDEYKNQWCKENNIPLIRIPYWHYDDLCLEDLLLETTQFRVA